MAIKYVAGRRIKVNATFYERGTDITSVLGPVLLRGIHAMLNSGKVVKVQTATTQSNKARQKISTTVDRALVKRTFITHPKLDR